MVERRPAEAPICGGWRLLLDRQLQRAGGSGADSELLYPVTERVGVKVKDFGGPARALDSAAAPFKSRKDMVSFNLGQGRKSRWRLGTCAVTPRAGRALPLGCFCGGDGNQFSIQLQDRFPRYNHGALNHILQLTDVSRPGVVQKVLHRIPGNAIDLFP